MKNQKHMAFTLAEILISLLIIGVVAAMTLPTLINTIDNKVKSHQQTVIEKRFVQGLNLYNSLQDGLNNRQYENTEEFLKGLSQYFKMSKICSSSDLKSCMPYSFIKYEKYDGTRVSIHVSDLENLSTLNLKSEDFYEPAGFITASGVPFVLALKKDCSEDPDEPLKNYSSCIDGIYDYNGSKNPNFLGNDIFSIFSAGPDRCVNKIGKVCMASAPFFPTQAEAQTAFSACNSIKNNGYYIDNSGKKKTISKVNNCPNFTSKTDYWLAARIRCENLGYKLPSTNQLASIATELYNAPTQIGDEESYNGTAAATDFTKKYKFTINIYPTLGFNLWSNEEHDWEYSAKTRQYTATSGTRMLPSGTNTDRKQSIMQAICVP